MIETPIISRSIKPETNSNQDMALLFRLQNDFNRALNLQPDPQDLLKRSYNPVTDRWHIEMLRQKGDEKGVGLFKQELHENMRTNLMERFHAVESYGELTMIDGNLYSTEFPEMPFSDVLKRGIDYRKSLGSQEQAREGERGELKGWEIINKTLADPQAKIGKTMISFSPPSIAEDGAYKGKFIDKYTLSQGEGGKRYVKRARIAVDWDYNDYKNAALSISPHFFEEYDQRPLDAWFLSHPLVLDKDLSPVNKHGLLPELFDSIYNDPWTQRLVSYYEKLISARNVEWKEIAFAFNALLNHTDDLKKNIEAHKQVSYAGEDFSSQRLYALVYQKGLRKVETVGGGGCPPNKGINTTGIFGSSGVNAGIDMFSNSVAKYGQQEWFTCPKCDYKADGPIGDECPGCHITKEQFASEEGAVLCD